MVESVRRTPPRCLWRRRACADMCRQIAVRDYVAKEIGAEHLVPMLGAYSRLDEIPFENLPSSFVLKANHDSGSTVIVTDKSHMMVDQRRRLKALSFRYGDRKSTRLNSSHVKIS